MTAPKNKTMLINRQLPKARTGIEGLDHITRGGLPVNRASLVLGASGTGKTMLAMEFVVHGIIQYNEPGVFISFEETAEELAANFAPLGFDLSDLVSRKKLFVDYIGSKPGKFVETGDYDLQGLLVRVENAVKNVGAVRIALDGINALFYGYSNAGAVRNALSQMFSWLREKGITPIITAESEFALVQEGLGQTLSHCVIVLTSHVQNKIATRYLRVAKYRGSYHGTDEFPFLITENGISVIPITSVVPTYEASTERVSTGIARLDTMMGGGYFRGSSVLISGDAGSGKTSVVSSFAEAACQRDESCVFFAFEESAAQVMRNMQSIGLNLALWVKKGLLRFEAMRPTLYGLETHLVNMERIVDEFKPKAVIIDPISNLIAVGSFSEVKSTLTRLVDFLKTRTITAIFTSLIMDDGGSSREVGITTLMDTWILLSTMEGSGEYNRLLYIRKSRGMAHSNQVREFLLTDVGIQLTDVYLGESGVLTGAARAMQEAHDQAASLEREQEVRRKQREYERSSRVLKEQIAALKADIEYKQEELNESMLEAKLLGESFARERQEMARIRRADTADPGKEEASSEPKEEGKP